MPQVMCWPREDPNAIIDRAVAALTAGELIALPTDTGTELACSAMHAEAMARLQTRRHHRPSNGVAQGGAADALGLAGQLLDWVPRISTLGMRLARRGWPGPLVLLNTEGLERGLLPNLPAPARDLLGEHEVIDEHR